MEKGTNALIGILVLVMVGGIAVMVLDSTLETVVGTAAEVEAGLASVAEGSAEATMIALLPLLFSVAIVVGIVGLIAQTMKER